MFRQPRITPKTRTIVPMADQSRFCTKRRNRATRITGGIDARHEASDQRPTKPLEAFFGGVDVVGRAVVGCPRTCKFFGTKQVQLCL